MCADGGKGDRSAEESGDKCGRGREENREELGEHAGNLLCVPHRNTVGCKVLFCLHISAAYAKWLSAA